MELCVSLISMSMTRASKRNFAMRNKAVLGSRGQTENSLKVEDLMSTGKLSTRIQKSM